MSEPVKISGVTIKTPHDFAIERFPLTEAGRVANGDMVMDIIAHKRRFRLEYRAISDSDLKQIIGLLVKDDQIFFNFQCQDGTEYINTTVYPGMIPAQVQRRMDPALGEWVWIDVRFQLIER